MHIHAHIVMHMGIHAHAHAHAHAYAHTIHVMQMHMCARLIPQLVMRAHRGRTMFGISSLFSEYINSTQPISENIFFRISGPRHDVPRGAWRAASTTSSSSSIDYTRFILFMISFLSCRRPSLLFRIYLIRRHRPACIRVRQKLQKKKRSDKPTNHPGHINYHYRIGDAWSVP
jgi:hypothetical protein